MWVVTHITAMEATPKLCKCLILQNVCMYVSDGGWSVTVSSYATIFLTYKIFCNIVLPCTPVITTATPISGDGITVCGCQCL